MVLSTSTCLKNLLHCKQSLFGGLLFTTHLGFSFCFSLYLISWSSSVVVLFRPFPCSNQADVAEQLVMKRRIGTNRLKLFQPVSPYRDEVWKPPPAKFQALQRMRSQRLL